MLRTLAALHGVEDEDLALMAVGRDREPLNVSGTGEVQLARTYADLRCPQGAPERVALVRYSEDSAYVVGDTVYAKLDSVEMVAEWNLAQLIREHGASMSICFGELRGLDLRGANLENARLRFADLTGADLTGADLCGADLSYSMLDVAKLDGANMTDGTFEGTYVKGTSFRGARVDGASFEGSDLNEDQFSTTEGTPRWVDAHLAKW